MSAAYYEDDKAGSHEQEIGSRDAFKKLIPYLASQRKPLLLCLALLVGTTLTSLAWPWLIQQAIDGPIQGQIANEPEYAPET